MCWAWSTRRILLNSLTGFLSLAYAPQFKVTTAKDTGIAYFFIPTCLLWAFLWSQLPAAPATQFSIRPHRAFIRSHMQLCIQCTIIHTVFFSKHHLVPSASLFWDYFFQILNSSQRELLCWFVLPAHWETHSLVCARDLYGILWLENVTLNVTLSWSEWRFSQQCYLVHHPLVQRGKIQIDSLMFYSSSTKNHW